MRERGKMMVGRKGKAKDWAERGRSQVDKSVDKPFSQL